MYEMRHCDCLAALCLFDSALKGWVFLLKSWVTLIAHSCLAAKFLRQRCLSVAVKRQREWKLISFRAVGDDVPGGSLRWRMRGTSPRRRPTRLPTTLPKYCDCLLLRGPFSFPVILLKIISKL